MAIASASPGHGRRDRRPRHRPHDREPAPNANLQIVGRVNDLAYGNVDSRLERTLTTLQEGSLRGYKADLNGAPAAVALALHHGEDCGVSFVATVPQARRHGLATQVMRSALADARRQRPHHDHAPGHRARRTALPPARAQASRPDGAVGKKTLSSTLCRARWPASWTENSARRSDPPPMWARRDLKSRILTYARRAFSLLLVLIATCAGGYLAIIGYDQTRELLGRRDPDVGLPRPPRRARPLRPARRLGRALRGHQGADPHPGRPPDRQPPGRDERRGGSSRSTSSRSATRRATRSSATSSA